MQLENCVQTTCIAHVVEFEALLYCTSGTSLSGGTGQEQEENKAGMVVK